MIAHQKDDIENLLERALELPPARRAAFLAGECAGDSARRERMERLLRLAESKDGFLERSPLHLGVDISTAGTLYAPGHRIGAYRLLRRIGSGGSAEVWLAERTVGGFQQRAAVKIIRDAHAALRDRFAVEREILASLTHPGIARLYDGGVEPDGSAYMVMEYVEGEHLGAYAETHSLSLNDRLALFLQVCDAVAYAHTRLVVHRDIKPANILVTADGHAKLLDFGIAKLIDAEPANDITRTLHLSPAYAAPEQLTGGYVSTSTDVYALGVTLFQLLTGRLPWARDGATLATAVERLLDASIPLPSRAAADDSPIPARALRGDLDAIVARALRKEPAARYADARALAEDVRRHLDHQPVDARAGARSYVLRRFLRRNWLALAVAAAVFVAMSVALIAIAWQVQKARLEAERAAAVQDFMVGLFRTNSSRQADPLKARQTTARELLDIGVKRVETELDQAPENKLALLRVFSALYNELGLLPEELALRQQTVALSRIHYGSDSLELASDLIALSEFGTTPDAIAEAKAILDGRKDVRSVLRGRLLVNMASFNSTRDIKQAGIEAREAVAILDAFAPSAELARAFYLQGMTDYYAARSSDAIAPLQRAIDVLRAVEGERSPSLANYSWVLASAESDVMQHAAAEASARQAIAYALATHSETPSDAVRAKIVLADVLAKADRIKEGLEVAVQAKNEAIALGDTGDGDFEAYARLRTGMIEGAAGDMEAGLSDAQQALTLRRKLGDPSSIAGALYSAAELLIETGRDTDALRALDEGLSIQLGMGFTQSRRNNLLRLRLSIDQGKPDDARAALSHFNVDTSNESTALAGRLRRDLFEVEIQLQEGHYADAAARAAAAVAAARDSALAPYLRGAIASGELLEGLARVRNGEAESAQALITRALATRVDLYLPKSPKIAEAQLALAECELARGHRDEALALVRTAEAIEAQHESLSERYRRPLQRLRALIAGAGNAATSKQTTRTVARRE